MTNNHKVLHMQYADDTLLFLKADPILIERVKWALRVFEGISGLKINFSKSELIPLNLDHSQADYFANILDCMVGKLSMKYLGVSLQ